MTAPDVRRIHGFRGFPRRAAWALAAVVPLACDGSVGPDEPGAITVRLATTGGDVDLDGYVLVVEGLTRQAPINGVLHLAGVPSGPRIVELGGIAPNCAVDGDNPRTVTVVAGENVDAALVIECVATAVWVTVTTTGLDAPGSYDLVLDDGSPTAVPANSSASFSRLTPGEHSVELGGVSAHCTVSGSNPVTMNVSSGETVIVSFTVSCSATTATSP